MSNVILEDDYRPIGSHELKKDYDKFLSDYKKNFLLVKRFREGEETSSKNFIEWFCSKIKDSKKFKNQVRY